MAKLKLFPNGLRMLWGLLCDTAFKQQYNSIVNSILILQHFYTSA